MLPWQDKWLWKLYFSTWKIKLVIVNPKTRRGCLVSNLSWFVNNVSGEVRRECFPLSRLPGGPGGGCPEALCMKYLGQVGGLWIH